MQRFIASGSFKLIYQTDFILEIFREKKSELLLLFCHQGMPSS